MRPSTKLLAAKKFLPQKFSGLSNGWKRSLRATSYVGSIGLSLLLFFAAANALTKRALLNEGRVSHGVAFLNQERAPFWVSWGLYKNTSNVFADNQQSQAVAIRGVRERYAALPRVFEMARLHPAAFSEQTRAWGRFLSLLPLFPGEVQKFVLIDCFINSLFPYDYAKYHEGAAAYERRTGKPWVQEPLETLARGTGTCEDIELMKEASIYLAFGDAFFQSRVSKLHLIVIQGAFDPAKVFDSLDAHAVLGITTGQRDYVMNIAGAQPPEGQSLNEENSLSYWKSFFFRSGGLQTRESFLAYGGIGDTAGFQPQKELFADGHVERFTILRQPDDPDDLHEVRGFVVMPQQAALPSSIGANPASPRLFLAPDRLLNARKLSGAQEAALSEIIGMVRQIRKPKPVVSLNALEALSSAARQRQPTGPEKAPQAFVAGFAANPLTP